MLMARQVISYVKPADLFATGCMPIRRVDIRIIETADRNHLDRYIMPLPFPGKGRSAGRTKTSQHTR